MSQVFFSPSAQYCSALDVVGPNGLGLYSGKTLDEFIFEYGDVTIVDGEVAYQHDRNRRITAPKEINEERFYWLLECLPPCKWGRYADGEAFHVSERITHDIVTWCVRLGNKLYSFDDTDTLTARQAMEKVATALEAA